MQQAGLYWDVRSRVETEIALWVLSWGPRAVPFWGVKLTAAVAAAANTRLKQTLAVPTHGWGAISFQGSRKAPLVHVAGGAFFRLHTA